LAHRCYWVQRRGISRGGRDPGIRQAAGIVPVQLSHAVYDCRGRDAGGTEDGHDAAPVDSGYWWCRFCFTSVGVLALKKNGKEVLVVLIMLYPISGYMFPSCLSFAHGLGIFSIAT